MQQEIINWVEDWYQSNCNGDWEHQYGITIETTDNPGWSVKIDLKNTIFEKEVKKYELKQNSEKRLVWL